MRDYKNLIGQRFGLLVVKEVLEREVDSGGYLKPARAMCKCDCGTLKSVKCNDLLSGKSLSCGCQKGNLHGRGGRPKAFNMKYYYCPSPEIGCTYSTVLNICCYECPKRDKCGGTCKNNPEKCGAVRITASDEARDFLVREDELNETNIL